MVATSLKRAYSAPYKCNSTSALVSASDRHDESCRPPRAAPARVRRASSRLSLRDAAAAAASAARGTITRTCPAATNQ